MNVLLIKKDRNMNFDRDFLRNSDLGLLVLRLSVGGLMLFHGIGKLIHGVDFIGGMLSQIGLPSFFAYGVLLGEFVAALMLVAGFWTRAAAVVMAGTMVVAILIAHLGDLCSINPQTGGWAIELPMLYLLGAGALFFTGGGKYSLTNSSVLD